MEEVNFTPKGLVIDAKRPNPRYLYGADRHNPSFCRHKPGFHSLSLKG